MNFAIASFGCNEAEARHALERLALGVVELISPADLGAQQIDLALGVPDSGFDDVDLFNDRFEAWAEKLSKKSRPTHYHLLTIEAGNDFELPRAFATRNFSGTFSASWIDGASLPIFARLTNGWCWILNDHGEQDRARASGTLKILEQKGWRVAPGGHDLFAFQHALDQRAITWRSEL